MKVNTLSFQKSGQINCKGNKYILSLTYASSASKYSGTINTRMTAVEYKCVTTLS